MHFCSISNSTNKNFKNYHAAINHVDIDLNIDENELKKSSKLCTRLLI